MIWRNPPIAIKMDSNSKKVYILLYFEIEFRKCCTTKGDTMHKLFVQPSAHSFSNTSSFLSQNSQLNTFPFLLFWQVRQCRTFSEALSLRGTAAVSAALPHLF